MTDKLRDLLPERNALQSQRAEESLRAYVQAQGRTFEGTLFEASDLIADLMHWAHGRTRAGDLKSPEYILSQARVHYEAEL